MPYINTLIQVFIVTSTILRTTALPQSALSSTSTSTSTTRRERKRQNPIIITPSETTAPSSEDESSGGIAIQIVIPIIVILVVAFVVILLILNRTRILASFRPSVRNALRPIPTQDSTRTLTAQQLSGHSSRVDLTNTQSQSQSQSQSRSTTTTTNDPPLNARERRRRERDRNIRRTESGRSVKTLPVYSKDAGDEELVLVRQRSESSFSSNQGSITDSESEQGETQVVEGDIETGLLPSNPRSNSIRSSGSHSRIPGDQSSSSPPLLSGGIRDESIELTARSASPTASSMPQSAPAEIPLRTDSLMRRESLARRGWGEAPTYLEAMSSPSSYPSGSSGEQANVPPPRGLKDRTSSTFMSLLSRAGITQPTQSTGTGTRARGTSMVMRENRNSSTSLLLHPTTSRASTFAYANANANPGGSSYNSPWNSTNDLLVISSPIPNTAIRASFDYTAIPKNGLTPDQMKFLSSQEAVNLAGIKMDDVPEYKKKQRRRSEYSTLHPNPHLNINNSGELGESSRRGSISTYQSLTSPSSSPSTSPERRESDANQNSLPSWQQSEDDRRKNQAFERRSLSKPVLLQAESEPGSQGEAEGIAQNEQAGPSGNDHRNEDAEAAQKSQSSANENQAEDENNTSAHVMPITTDSRISSQKESEPASPQIFVTAQTAPSTCPAISIRVPSTSAPTLEIEPPTPILTTSPPLSAIAITSSIRT
ncbi:uncharacterized protein IL334_004800 [Kwoniella shivajii]|uniref:Uncharacterized protein n=1 Tax=Kwoniella shivajii TaxID=564305 RepID=A0ABZ1D1C0_9TREE|nr:hypothetical protein IL334_004800 [Kwoniella shivajii]